jgi:hypothetical protein
MTTRILGAQIRRGGSAASEASGTRHALSKFKRKKILRRNSRANGIHGVTEFGACEARFWFLYPRRLNVSEGARRGAARVLERPPTVILLLVRADAVGINLTEASHVFLMEPRLNSALEKQSATSPMICPLAPGGLAISGVPPPSRIGQESKWCVSGCAFVVVFVSRCRI